MHNLVHESWPLFQAKDGWVLSIKLFLFLCSLPPGCEFGQADMQKLVPKEEKPSSSAATSGGRRTGKKTLPHGDSA